jgi:hypothetical protein
MITIDKNGCYFRYHEYKIRHVWRIDGDRVYYDSYYIADGKAGLTGSCTIKNFKRWFSREATPEETNKLDFDENRRKRRRLQNFISSLSTSETQLIVTYMMLSMGVEEYHLPIYCSEDF